MICRRLLSAQIVAYITLLHITKLWTPYLVSVLRYKSSSMKELRIFKNILKVFLKILEKYFWQKNEGIILDDGSFVGTKTSIHPCSTSWERMVFVCYISFEKKELQLKKIQTLFYPLFAQNSQVWRTKKFDVIFRLKYSLEIVFTIFKAMESAFSLSRRYRGSKIAPNFLGEKHEVEFFEIFRRNCSIGSCAFLTKTWYWYLFSILRNVPHKFEN